MKKVYVFYINSHDDLIELAPIIRSKKIAGLNCVLVRYSVNPDQTKRQLIDMVERYGLTGAIKGYFVSDCKSLSETLADEGLTVIGYYGSYVLSFDKTVTKDQLKKNNNSVRLRFACVCNKCENIISEHVRNVTRDKAVKATSAYNNHASFEIDVTDSFVNIIDTSGRCMLC